MNSKFNDSVSDILIFIHPEENILKFRWLCRPRIVDFIKLALSCSLSFVEKCWFFLFFLILVLIFLLFLLFFVILLIILWGVGEAKYLSSISFPFSGKRKTNELLLNRDWFKASACVNNDQWKYHFKSLNHLGYYYENIAYFIIQTIHKLHEVLYFRDQS